MSLPTLFAVLVIGALVGFLGGLFGKGGSAIATPLLAAVGIPPFAALASPLPATIPATLVAARAYWRAGHVDWRLVRWCVAIGLPATALGAYATQWVSGSVLVVATEIVLAGLGVRFLLRPGLPDEVVRDPAWMRTRIVAVAAIVGVVSGLLANSGGFLLAPLFVVVLHRGIKDAFGASLSIGAALAIPGAAIHAALGHIDWTVVAVFGAASIPLSYVGARVALRTHGARLERIYGAVLATLGVGLLVFAALIRYRGSRQGPSPAGTEVAMGITRVVSVDGGGIRGIVPVVVMQRLAAEPGLEGWLDRTELIAGTSTGGLIALCVAAGVPLADLRDLYVSRAGSVFADSFLDDVKDFGKVFGADYDVANLEREAHRVLGERTLAELTTRVLVTAFDLDNGAATDRRWKAKLFHNFPGPDSDGSEPAYRVAVATAAAPTYFASYDGYVDGGVFATNPSMCALAQTQDVRLPADERADLAELRLLSFGTGRTLRYIEGDRLDWGYWQWVRPLLDLMLDGVNGIADYQCTQLLGDRYHRVAPTFPAGRAIGMDAIAEIPYLVEFATALDLSATIDWLRANW